MEQQRVHFYESITYGLEPFPQTGAEQSSSVPRPSSSFEGHEGRLIRDRLPDFFPREAIVSSSGMDKDAHSLMLSIH